MTRKFDIEVMRPVLPDADALAPYLQQIDQTGWYANRGPLTKELEQRLADHFGVERHRLVTTSSCTSGLQMAYLTARRPGARYVLTPSWTFAAAPLAAMAAGLIPFFLDVDPDSQQLTPEIAKTALHRLGAETVAAVSPVSPQGAPVDLDGWAAFQAETGCRVVHDAAAAFISVQASDIVSCVSLHATKLLPAGEGGFVLCPDVATREEIKVRSNFGFDDSRESQLISANAKISEYHAAIGLAAMDQLPDRRGRLMQLARRMNEMVSALPGVSLPEGFGAPWCGTTAVIRFDAPVARDCAAHLARQGIETRFWWARGCHRQPAFADCPRDDLAMTDRLAESTLGLPFHAALSEADLGRIGGALEGFLAARRRAA